MDKTKVIAKNVLLDCFNVKSHEEVLIITDHEYLDLASSFSEASRQLQAKTTLVEIDSSEKRELPLLASRALEVADVCLIITKKSYTHTKARVNANNRGCRIASMPGISKEIVLKTFNPNYDQIERMSKKLADMLSVSRMVRLTTDLGTSLIFNTEGRKGIADTGKLNYPGAFGNLPAGEAMVAPIENLITGKLVVDGVICGVGIPEKPVELTIENGRIEHINGDNDELKYFLDRFDDNIWKIAEFGIGTNQSAEIMNNPLVDEKVFTTVHIGFGNNLFMGGKQDSNMHFDMIIKKPTVYFDDICVIENGEHIY